MGALLVFVSLGVFAWSALGLISPRIARLRGRLQAVGLFGLSVVLFAVAGAMLPEPSPEAEREVTRNADGEAVRAAERERPASTRGTGLTIAQRNAVRSANSYLQLSGFSRRGLIEQLSSDFGDGYNVGDATVAVDSLSVDWNAQAARSAAAYLQISGFSCRGLIQQLSSDAGDSYTVEQATYGATQAGIC